MTPGRGTGRPPRACLPVCGAASPAFTGEERAPVFGVCHSTCLVLEVSLLVKLGIYGLDKMGLYCCRRHEERSVIKSLLEGWNQVSAVLVEWGVPHPRNRAEGALAEPRGEADVGESQSSGLPAVFPAGPSDKPATSSTFREPPSAGFCQLPLRGIYRATCDGR